MKRSYVVAALGMMVMVLGLSQLFAGQPVDLLDGVKWEYSTDGGQTFAAGPVKVAPEATLKILARANFEMVTDATDLVALQLENKPASRTAAEFSLNGADLKGPMPEMLYKTIPAIDVSTLTRGQNTLIGEFTVTNTSSPNRKAEELTIAADARLLALADEHLQIQSGPIMGAADEKFYSLTLRTNLPAKVSIETAGQEPIASNGTLFHRLLIPRSYSPATIRVTTGKQTILQQITAPKWQPEPLEFVILGDSRTNPNDWRIVSTAASTRKPSFVVVSGDLIAAGKDDVSWDREFFSPGRQLLGTTPTYVVIGNHEQNAPLYDEMFYTPGKDGKQRNWTQQIGSVLLIGIDGAQDWSAQSANAQWLEQILAAAGDAKFVFLTSHYPAWSSSAHGSVDENGLPKEKPMLQMRQTVAPLLEKYNATAMFAGHDHTYERSETDDVTYITSGGAGAPRYPKSKVADVQNPHSVQYNSSLHYCQLTISGDTCTMTVYTPQGEQIDQRTWKARTLVPAGATR